MKMVKANLWHRAFRQTTKPHATTLVRVTGRELVPIDIGLAPSIKTLTDAYLLTNDCCQGGPGDGWVSFSGFMPIPEPFPSWLRVELYVLDEFGPLTAWWFPPERLFAFQSFVDDYTERLWKNDVLSK